MSRKRTSQDARGYKSRFMKSVTKQSGVLKPDKNVVVPKYDLLSEGCDPAKLSKASKFNVAELQEKLDAAQNDLWDREDQIRRSEIKLSNVISEMNSRKDVYNMSLNGLKREVEELTRKLGITEDNRKYACDHIFQLNETIRLAQSQIEKLRYERINADHLAKQVVKLQQEKETLQTENFRMTKEVSELHNELAIYNIALLRIKGGNWMNILRDDDHPKNIAINTLDEIEKNRRTKI